MTASSRTLLPRNTLSRDSGVSSVDSARSASRRQAISPNAADEHEREERQVHRPDDRLRERVDRGQDAPPREERPEHRQRERADHEREVPDLQHPAAFLHHHRMQERGRREPRQQRDVLDRIPRPVAAPAEHAVGPERAEREPDRQERPRGERPPPRDPDPVVAHASGDQSRDRERERHGEPDEPQIEERRMRRHQRVVLQQRQRPVPVGRHRGERRERRRRPEDEQQVERDDPVHRRERPPERLGTPRAEPERDRGEVPAEDEVPQQERALVGRPQREDLEERRRRDARVRGDVADREVVRQQGDEHRRVRDEDEREH